MAGCLTGRRGGREPCRGACAHESDGAKAPAMNKTAIDKTAIDKTGAIGLALLSAALFGASTPAAKMLLGSVSPWLLAGLLYLGSGVGLGAAVLVQRLSGRAKQAPLRA